VTAHLAWRQWLNDGYWGIGNGTTLDRAYVGSFDDDDPRRKRYRYSLFQPFAHVTLRVAMTRRWSLFVAQNLKYSVVRTYEGSLLEEQRPFGMQGGVGLLLSTGVIYDSREPEVNPRRGIFAEVSGRVASDLPGGAGAFGGLFVSFRSYLSLTSSLVLASRVMGEWLFGEIPFYEMVHWGGSVPVTGFGGFETLRGVPFGRWRAPGKAILNTEARFHVFRHTIFGKPMVWQLALLFDAGAVFGAGDSAHAPDPAFPIHPAWGLGVRVIFQEVFVGRVDTGIGLDRVREPEGHHTTTPSFGIYVVFDHAF
jgi:outer membrane protein assembly factor BamA